jgi:hypothetical protein
VTIVCKILRLSPSWSYGCCWLWPVDVYLLRVPAPWFSDCFFRLLRFAGFRVEGLTSVPFKIRITIDFRLFLLSSPRSELTLEWLSRKSYLLLAVVVSCWFSYYPVFTVGPFTSCFVPPLINVRLPDYFRYPFGFTYTLYGLTRLDFMSPNFYFSCNFFLFFILYYYENMAEDEGLWGCKYSWYV